jgi:hypothetical protein
MRCSAKTSFEVAAWRNCVQEIQTAFKRLPAK